MRKTFLVLFSIFCFSLSASFISAKTDVSLSQTDITFSQQEIKEGDIVRIYARIYNNGTSDVTASVVFLNNGKEIATPQPISLKPTTYDDVFVDWKADSGNHNIEAKIVNSAPADETPDNNNVIRKDIVVTQNTTPNVASSNETSFLDQLKEKISTISLGFGQALEKFAESNPVKDGIENINNAVDEKVSSIYESTKEQTTSPDKKYEIDYSKSKASLYDSALNYLKRYQRVIYLTLGAALLAALLYVLLKKKPMAPLE